MLEDIGSRNRNRMGLNRLQSKSAKAITRKEVRTQDGDALPRTVKGAQKKKELAKTPRKPVTK